MSILLTVLAADAIWESSKEVLKLKGGEFLEKFGEKLFSRTKEGSLPPNHNLDHALRHSLGKSARVLAYAIHNPDLLPLSELIAESQNCAAALMEIRIDVAESYILEDSNVVAARDDLLSCLRELSKDTQAKQRREVLALLGHAESFLDNFEDSKSLYREARQLAQKQKNRFAEAHALMGLSHAEEFLGNLKEANSLLDEATELNRAEYREAKADEKPRAALNLNQKNQRKEYHMVLQSHVVCFNVSYVASSVLSKTLSGLENRTN